jgi:hypothetical protein
MSVYDKIVKIIKLQPDDAKYLSVTSVDGSLRMVRYKESNDVVIPPEKQYIYTIRGTIVDIDRGYVVSPGVPAIASSRTWNYNMKGDTLSFYAETATMGTVEQTIDINDTSKSIHPFYEGVYVQCFMHRGKYYESSLRTLDIRTNASRWGAHNITFAEMKDMCGAPSQNDLYPAGCKESPYVYLFYVCHPLLNTNSLLKTDPRGFVRYDGPYVNNMPDNLTLEDVGTPDTEVTTIEVIYPTQQSDYSPGNIIDNVNVSLKEAFTLLTTGYHGQAGEQDIRLSTAESLFVFTKDSAGNVIERVHYKSIGYTYRESMYREESANHYRSFVFHMAMARPSALAKLYDMAQGDDGKLVMVESENRGLDSNGELTIYGAQALVQLMVPTILKDGVDMNTFYSELEGGETIMMTLVTVITAQDMVGMDASKVREMLELDFLVNCSPYYRGMARNYMKRYEFDTGKLAGFLNTIQGDKDIKWLRDMKVQTNPDQQPRSIPPKVVDRIAKITEMARAAESPYDKLRELIADETASSLYKLIKNMYLVTGDFGLSLAITEPDSPFAKKTTDRLEQSRKAWSEYEEESKNYIESDPAVIMMDSYPELQSEIKWDGGITSAPELDVWDAVGEINWDVTGWDDVPDQWGDDNLGV